MSDPATPDLARRWGVELVERARSGHNEVWFGLRGDEHVVLKRGDPRAREREAAALAAYGPCAAQLLEHDPGAGALLVERVLLGDDLLPLAAADDDAATAVVGCLIVELHGSQAVPDAHDLPALASLATAFAAAPDPRLPHPLVRRAEALFAELVPTSEPVVLHGDLQHTNVLRHGVGDDHDRWRAIDPHGWVGDRAFEAAALLANPRGLGDRSDEGRRSRPEKSDEARRLGSAALAERRVAVLAETTGLDRDRLLAWAFTAAVIAELWMLEDHGLVHGAPLALAEALADRV